MEWIRPDGIECPKCGARGFQSFALQYCPGNLPPDAQVRHVDGRDLGSVEIPCGGVLEEHLHVHCRICHHNRLMETKESADNKARGKLTAAHLHSARSLGEAIHGN